MSEHSSPSGQAPQGPLRASDHDRQLVADLLSAAHADGRLDLDELHERLEAAWTARTIDDLTPLTADLAATGTACVPSGVVRVGTATTTRQTRITVMGSHRSPPGAPLAATTRLAAVMGDVVLDLRGSSFAAPVCTITLQCVMGSVAIIVPDGVSVHDETLAVMGDTRVRGVRPRPGAPVLVLRGTVLMGSLVVRGPAS